MSSYSHISYVFTRTKIHSLKIQATITFKSNLDTNGLKTSVGKPLMKRSRVNTSIDRAIKIMQYTVGKGLICIEISRRICHGSIKNIPNYLIKKEGGSASVFKRALLDLLLRIELKGTLYKRHVGVLMTISFHQNKLTWCFDVSKITSQIKLVDRQIFIALQTCS